MLSPRHCSDCFIQNGHNNLGPQILWIRKLIRDVVIPLRAHSSKVTELGFEHGQSRCRACSLKHFHVSAGRAWHPQNNPQASLCASLLCVSCEEGVNVRFPEHRGRSSQGCLTGVWMAEGGRSWALKAGERGCRQTRGRRALGQRGGAGLGRDRVRGECRKAV